MPPKLDTTISSLGPCRHPSPLALNTIRGDGIRNFISDQTRIRYEVEISGTDGGGSGDSREIH